MLLPPISRIRQLGEGKLLNQLYYIPIRESACGNCQTKMYLWVGKGDAQEGPGTVVYKLNISQTLHSRCQRFQVYQKHLPVYHNYSGVKNSMCVCVHACVHACV